MRQCLQSSDGGYYARSPNAVKSDTPQTGSTEILGRKGDFTTSPEISQIFGELVAVWFVSEYMAQGRPREGVQLLEFGPGRGTLMDDLLRTITRFNSFKSAIECVWLIETSGVLREKQAQILLGEGVALESRGSGAYEATSQKYPGMRFRWVEDAAQLPKAQDSQDKMPFIVAHEFFDALPIHAFESVAPSEIESETKMQLLDAAGRPLVRRSRHSREPQWRELLVAPFKKRLPSGVTSTITRDIPVEEQPDFQLTLAKASTPTSLVLPEASPRYKALKSKPGSTIEVSPESQRYIRDFAHRIGGMTGEVAKPSGAALIIDYGPAETIPANSLRGIKAHKRTSPFLTPGLTDLSSDVDFGALVDAALAASEGVEIHGPVEQAFWLEAMGGNARLDMLLKNVPDEERKKNLETGWHRLVDRLGGMGKVYKILSIVPERGGKRPIGFGGSVSM